MLSPLAIQQKLPIFGKIIINKPFRLNHNSYEKTKNIFSLRSFFFLLIGSANPVLPAIRQIQNGY